MAIKLGSTDINSVNLGSVGLNRIYSGSDVVFGDGSLKSLYSYRMTGTSEYVRFTNYSTIDYSAGDPISFQSTFKLSGTGNFILVSSNNYNATNGWWMSVNTSVASPFIQVYYISSSGNLRVSRYYTSGLTLSTWHNILFTASDFSDINTHTLYLDGTQLTKTNHVNSGTVTSLAGNDVGIGSFPNGNFYFNGDINMTTIWNTNFDSSQATSQYNSGIPVVNFQIANCIFRHRVDDDSWDSGNLRFNAINDFGLNGIALNMVEADKVLSSPY